MNYDLYVWKAPRDLEPADAAALVERWEDGGGDPASSPFEASTDLGWFYRELAQGEPGLVTSTDAVPTQTRTPIWLSSEDEPPARVVAIRIGPSIPPAVIESIVGLAAKYDLVLWDARRRTIHRPLDELAEEASATFWPAGAIQAAVAGIVGGAIAVGAWIASIPVVSGIAIVIGGFLAIMSVLTFVQEGRKRIGGGSRRGPGS